MDKPNHCCTDHESESGCRNNYFDGKRLTTDSFRVEQRYSLDRRHLLNRAIHGWGVVYGFAITKKADRLEVGPGLALDACGRELLQSGTRPVSLGEMFAAGQKGQQSTSQLTFSSGTNENTCWLLSAHYAEQSLGQKKVEDSCNCQHEEWERTCETVRYSLRQIECGEHCCEPKCDLKCDCTTGQCCQKHAHDEGTPRPSGRGGCRCLCQHLMDLQPGVENCSLTEIEDPCGRVSADLRNGVPLACVTLVRDEHDCWSCIEVDACGPRRLVKRNDLLFDLIRGCDLTKISEIGWKDWHRRKEEVPFDDFSYALGPEGYHEDAYVTRYFWVRFSRPVRRETLRPDCFSITVLSGEREGGWSQVLRVPILRVDVDSEEAPRQAIIVVDGAWVEDGVRGRRSLFIGSKTDVEIEVRGDFIVDCNGQAVDANAVGIHQPPTGNGTPGGTFVSSFRVAARDKSYAASDRVKGASS